MGGHMQLRNQFYRTLFLANVVLIATSQTLFAQDGKKVARLEEVVVTAERRAQSSQDVPLAVTTFSGDMIGPSGISDLGDIAVQTPNLTFTQFNIGEPQLFLRGVGSTSDSAGSDPTVSIFIDGVYIGRGGSGSSDMYDLQRVEVLRGPQGTLYGRNVTGGAISIFTEKPSREFHSKAGATLGNENLTIFRGLVSGPISDNLAGKFAFSKRDHDGYAKNITNGQDLDDADNLSVRAQLLWTPSTTTDVLFGLDYSRDRANGDCRNLAKLDVRPQERRGDAFIDDLKAIIAEVGNGDPRTCAQSLVQDVHKDIYGSLLTIDHDFGSVQLTSITAYREAEYDWLQELTGMDAPPGLLSVRDFEGEESDQFSQELRLSASSDNLFWVSGLYGIRETVDRFAFVPIQWGQHPDIPTSGVLLDRKFFQKAENTSYAVFGQLTWSFTDTLDLTLGGRQTWDKKEMDQKYMPSPDTVAYDLEGLSERWDRFTGRVTLDWKLTDNHMLYATWSEGFKSGIFLSQSTSAVEAASTLDPEDATSIEVGAKTEWFDNRLRFNITYFDLEIENLQLFRLVDFTLISENATIESSGLEMDFMAAVTDSLTLSGNASTLDAEYVGGQFDGNIVPRSPDYKYSLTGNYNLPLGGGGGLDFNVTMAYSDDYYMEPTNFAVSYHDGYTVWDASVTYTSARGDWDLQLWGKNLDDELIVRHSIVSSYGGSTELYAPPRTYGVTFNYYWE